MCRGNTISQLVWRLWGVEEVQGSVLTLARIILVKPISNVTVLSLGQDIINSSSFLWKAELRTGAAHVAKKLKHKAFLHPPSRGFLNYGMFL